MAKRRRNKLVLWEWSPDGRHMRDGKRRPPSAGRDAVTAILLLGTILVVFSLLPPATGYRRDGLGRFVCEAAGVATGSASCFGVAIGGWFLFVVTVGVVLKAARHILRPLRGR